MPQATVKYAQDSLIAAWLADMRAQGVEQSRAIRCALEAYLSEHGNNPPPPPAPINPAPGGGGIDYDKLGEVMYAVMTQVFDEHQTTIPQGAPLNNAPSNGRRPQPVVHMETSTMVEREDDDGGAVPLDYVSDSPEEILRSMGMA